MVEREGGSPLLDSLCILAGGPSLPVTSKGSGVGRVGILLLPFLLLLCRLMLGFMGVTAFLSMWISNTATTAMMVPIVEAVLQQMEAASTATEASLGALELADKGKASDLPGKPPTRVLPGFPATDFLSVAKSFGQLPDS